MKITNVTIENFLGIGDAVINLQDKGLVLVQGENLDDPSADSNGSGKSSMIDAIFWGLYGKTARGLAGDDVINRVIGKQCIVTVELEDGEETAVITRWRKAKGFHKRSGVGVTINGIDQSGGTDSLTQVEIDRLIGCSEQVFAAAVYTGQEAMVDIPSLSDRQLKSLIEEAAGIDLIEQAYEIAREQMREVSNEVGSAEEAVTRANVEQDRAGERAERVALDQKEWEKERNRKVEHLKEEQTGVAMIIRDRKAAIEEFDATGIEAEIAEKQAKSDEIDDAMQEIDKQIAGVDEENEVGRAHDKQVSAAETELNLLTKTAKLIRKAFEELKAEYEDVDSKVGEPCRTCGKPTTEEDLAAVREGLKQQLKDKRAEYDDMRSQVSLAKSVHEAAVKARDKFDSERTDISAQQAQQSELKKIQRDIANDIKTLSAKLSELPTLKSKLTEAKERYERMGEQIESVKEETNPHDKSVERAVNEFQEAIEEVKKAKAWFAESAKTLVVAKAAVKVFGPKGVRAHILDTVTPFLNDRTAHYLSTLSDGSLEAVWSTLTESRTGELKEKFTIGVEKYGTGTFASLSGGEKRKVRLATTLALQDLVSSRATKPIHLWIGDEIDTALDPAGLERLMTLLEMKAREKGTVLIVSHHDLKDWVRDTVTVTMEGKSAKVEGVLCP